MNIRRYRLNKRRKKNIQRPTKKTLTEYIKLFKTWSFRGSLFILILFVLISLGHILFQQAPVMTLLTIPDSLGSKGYTSRNITLEMLNKMENILLETDTLMAGQDIIFSSEKKLNAITLPGGILSMGQIVNYIKTIFNISSNEFSGGINETNNDELEFTLYYKNKVYTRYRGLPKDMNHYIQECAEAILKEYQPQRLGFYYYYNKRNNKTEELTKHMLISPSKKDDVWAYILWAWGLEDQKNFSEAGRLYRKAVNLNPKHSCLWSCWGHALAKADKEGESIIKHKQAIRLRPESWYAHFMLSKSLLVFQHYNEALELLMKADKLSPNNHDILMQRAYTYYKMDNYELSTQNYQKALDIRPNNLKTIWNVGYLYDLIGQYEKSMCMMEYYIKFNPNALEHQGDLLRVLYNSGEYDSVFINSQELLKKKYSNFEPHYYCGLIFYKRGQYKKALEKLNHTLNYPLNNSKKNQAIKKKAAMLIAEINKFL